MQLVWAARSPHVPVAIRVSSFGGVKGMIVTLSDACNLQVAYLGTDPPMQAVTAAENKELDYEAMDEEHRKLLRIIRQASTDTMAEPKEKLNLRVSIPQVLDTGAGDSFGNPDEDKDCARDETTNKFRQVTVTLFVSYTGKEDLENVTLSLSVPSAFKTNTKSILIPSISTALSSSLPFHLLSLD
jgi:Bardet-Biedl syndrome 9 protein